MLPRLSLCLVLHAGMAIAPPNLVILSSLAAAMRRFWQLATSPGACQLLAISSRGRLLGNLVHAPSVEVQARPARR